MKHKNPIRLGNMKDSSELQLERFFSAYDVCEISGCWNWKNAKKPNGYAQMTARVDGYKKIQTAHRFSYLIHNHDYDEDLMVLHKCDNRSCVNPDHLFQGTAKDNSKDMVNKGRTTRPPGTKGNLLTEEMIMDAKKRYRYYGRGGPGFTTLAKEYGVHRTTIEHAVKGMSWKHVK